MYCKPANHSICENVVILVIRALSLSYPDRVHIGMSYTVEKLLTTGRYIIHIIAIFYRRYYKTEYSILPFWLNVENIKKPIDFTYSIGQISERLSHGIDSMVKTGLNQL